MSDYADNLRRSMINKTRRFMRMVQEMQEKDDAALREQVIRMAREAGIDAESDTLCRYEGWVEPLQRFFLLAAAAGANAALEAAARQALEALTVAWQQNPRWQITESMHALRAALKEKA